MSSSALPIVSRALAALLLPLSIAVATPAQAQSPTPVTAKQLKELHIGVVHPE